MTTRKERLLQKLDPKFLKMTPKLSGDTGSFIDLNSNDSSLEDGARKLMMRFLRNQDLCDKFKRRHKQSDLEVTLSSANYNENDEVCEIVSERLTIPHVVDPSDEVDNERPGRKLQKLKMELQDKMSAKWEEEYKKRVSENKSFKDYIESKGKEEKKKLSEDENSGDELDGEKVVSEAEEEEGTKELDKEENCDFDADIEDELSEAASDEENKSDDDNEDDKSDEEDTTINNCNSSEGNVCNKDDESEESESCSLLPAYQPGGGLLYGGSELTQCEEDLPQNLLTPSLKLSITESPSSKSFIDMAPKNTEEIATEETDNIYFSKSKLFSNSQNVNDSFDLNDAFEFCSGKFPDAEVAKTVVESQTSVNGDSTICDENDGTDKSQSSSEEKFDSNNEDEVLDSSKDMPKTRRNIIAFEDSEPEENFELNEVDEPQFPSSKMLSDDDEETLVSNTGKKKRKILHFSDEEDEGVGGKKDFSSESEESEASDCDEVVGDGAEDCDQKSINYDSEENEIINPKEFFEGEAELSGSEWSGDEDERGLDEFDKEDGDADQIDHDQVRSQLEKIHIRRVLDDDAREVRLIQEILFEDGDLHSDGKGRDRKFKWKNLGTFDDKENEGESKEDGGNTSEEDCAEEEQLRKMRHEKELFLMEKKKDRDLSSDEEILEENFQSVKVTTLKSSVKLCATNENRSDAFKTILDYSQVTKSLTASNSRGSFLTRNEEFLSRLAKATSGVTDNVLGPKNSKNFVFATKSPTKTETEKNIVSKRQVEETEICSRREKRLKVMPPEIDTGPSILDLLV